MASDFDTNILGFDSSQRPVVEGLKRFYIWPLIFILYFGLAALYPTLQGVDVVRQVLISSVDLIVLAVAITFVLAAAEIDLSIVGTMGVAPFAAVLAIKDLGVPGIVAILGIIPLVAVIVGLLNAYLVNRLEIDSLIATLGSYFLLVGLLFFLTQGATVSGFGDTYVFVGNNTIFGIEWMLIVMVGIVVAAHLIMTRHPFGQDLLLTGGDEDSASRSGIDTDRVRRWAFVICAVLAAFAGYLLSSRLAIISSTFGQGRLLAAIAAPILGGIRLSGGKASVHQAVGGAILLQMINTCLTIAGIDGYFIQLYTGILVLIAIVLGGLRTYATS